MPHSRREVAIPREKNKSPGGMLVRSRPIDIVQHNEVRHVLLMAPRQTKLGFNNIVGHRPDAGDLVM